VIRFELALLALGRAKSAPDLTCNGLQRSWQFAALVEAQNAVSGLFQSFLLRSRTTSERVNKISNRQG